MLERNAGSRRGASDCRYDAAAVNSFLTGTNLKLLSIEKLHGESAFAFRRMHRTTAPIVVLVLSAVIAATLIKEYFTTTTSSELNIVNNAMLPNATGALRADNQSMHMQPCQVLQVSANRRVPIPEMKQLVEKDVQVDTACRILKSDLASGQCSSLPTASGVQVADLGDDNCKVAFGPAANVASYRESVINSRALMGRSVYSAVKGGIQTLSIANANNEIENVPVFADTSIGGGRTWVMAMKYNAGSMTAGHGPVNLWNTTNASPISVANANAAAGANYVAPINTLWRLPFDFVCVQVMKGSQTLSSWLFSATRPNGQRVDTTNWFSRETYATSIFPTSSSAQKRIDTRTLNSFDMNGNNIGRTWFVNRSYGGCGGDIGWLVCPAGTACRWDQANRGGIVTSLDGEPLNWARATDANRGTHMIVWLGLPAANQTITVRIVRPKILGDGGDNLHHLHIRHVDVYNRAGAKLRLMCSKPCASSSFPNHGPEVPIREPATNSVYHSDFRGGYNRLNNDHFLEYVVSGVPSARDIGRIQVANRSDCCQQRLRGGYVEVLENGIAMRRFTFDAVQNDYTFNL
jgi:hypothetical protein